MKMNFKWMILAVSIAALGAFACGDSDSDDGKGGTGGTAGQSTGGTGGDGTGGTGGDGTGGTGGDGTGGTGGDGGTGGTGGEGGTGGTGGGTPVHDICNEASPDYDQEACEACVAASFACFMAGTCGDEFAAADACVETHCADATPEEEDACAEANCKDQIGAFVACFERDCPEAAACAGL